VWCDGDVWQGPQLTTRWQRFFFEDIQHSTSYPALLHCLDQTFLTDHTSTTNVDENAFLHKKDKLYLRLRKESNV
jgi:hypothetical protein